jgi:hypothetical protein
MGPLGRLADRHKLSNGATRLEAGFNCQGPDMTTEQLTRRRRSQFTLGLGRRQDSRSGRRSREAGHRGGPA